MLCLVAKKIWTKKGIEKIWTKKGIEKNEKELKWDLEENFSS